MGYLRTGTPSAGRGLQDNERLASMYSHLLQRYKDLEQANEALRHQKLVLSESCSTLSRRIK
jgi:hypothetical protein